MSIVTGREHENSDVGKDNEFVFEAINGCLVRSSGVRHYHKLSGE